MADAETPWRPTGLDLGVGAACAAVSVLLLVGLPAVAGEDPDLASLDLPTPGDPAWWALVVGCLAQAALVVLVRRSPRVVPVAVAAVAVVLPLVAPAGVSGLATVAILVAVLRAVAQRPVVRLAPSLVATAVLLTVGETLNSVRGVGIGPAEAVLAALVQAAGIVGLPLLGGLVVRSRREARDARRDELSARVGERDALVQAAVARERTAMARELHDIAAHHLSGIALMAAVVDRQIDSAPEEAHRGIRQVRAQSMDVLDDLRRLVGLLREDPDQDAERSVETLAAVPELVDRARVATGGSVELRVQEAPGRPLGQGIGPLAQLAVYRTVQESLTNAAAHAPGSACVVEVDDRDAAALVATVTNGPGDGAAVGRSLASAAGGFGLLGMRERAELVGAELAAGSTAEGGWRVRMAVPRERDARAGSAVGTPAPAAAEITRTPTPPEAIA
ncbi:signal transduction histidine kinase [Clavibacter sp. B3I6]|uniref:sensor histidine kinase n=1 Tax=Clavibacter sp. B3I6 TaxID=3042268 RepID=UPI00277D75D7|nr:histidine kinase [Clavibacter sp. B3I6]MDQ0745540.1 signal transduction histidine kinase [Clavibacter sp. B3I6]